MDKRKYLAYCGNLHSNHYRNELYDMAKKVGLPVTSKSNKEELCSAIAIYAMNRDQKGGYFDPVLNQQIDDDIQGGSDFADDLYDYDANMEDDEDIEDDDDGDDDDDLDETGYEIQQGGYSQMGGVNYEVSLPIGLVHRSYIRKLINELPKIRSGARARMEWREDKNASQDAFAKGMVWIVTQNPKVLEDLQSQTEDLIRELEEQNAMKNPKKGAARSTSSRTERRAPSSERFEEKVQLPGSIHKRHIGEVLKSLPQLKEAFPDLRVAYKDESDRAANIASGYFLISSPNSIDEVYDFGDTLKKLLTDLYERSKKEKDERVAAAISRQQSKARSSTTTSATSVSRKIPESFEDEEESGFGSTLSTVTQSSPPKTTTKEESEVPSSWED